jgi:NADPH-dependent 2,4-dienoyl-CoA reductase/sulfur reductase-like enzyme
MKTLRADVVVIGGGPAGLAAAYRAKAEGAETVLVLERNRELGGILPQCIHNGFGVRHYGEDLTGPEYAARWVREALGAGVEALLETMVLDIQPGPRVVATNRRDGILEVEARALVLAMGCRERPRGALAIPGLRPAGVYTAGTAQRLVNIEGYMPGERVVILGSGDIGMIMARRMTIEGAEVAAVAEILPFVSGLRRNLVQCIRDFDIPLHLCTTVTEVRGAERVESVVLSQVDARWRPVPGTEEEIACDTLLLSVGLIPENELSRLAGVALDASTGGPLVDERLATGVPGIFAAGNVVHVYDLVDEVTGSALRAGRYAAEHALGAPDPGSAECAVRAGENVHHVVPQRLHVDGLRREAQRLEFRVRQPIEAPATVEVRAGEEVVASRRLRYARPAEMITLDLPPRAADAVAAAGEIHVSVFERPASAPRQRSPRAEEGR